MFVVGAVIVGGAIVHSNHSRYSRHSQYSDASKVAEIEEQKRLIQRKEQNYASEKRVLEEQIAEAKELILEELELGGNPGQYSTRELEAKVNKIYAQRIEDKLAEDQARLEDIDATIKKILEIQLKK